MTATHQAAARVVEAIAQNAIDDLRAGADTNTALRQAISDLYRLKDETKPTSHTLAELMQERDAEDAIEAQHGRRPVFPPRAHLKPMDHTYAIIRTDGVLEFTSGTFNDRRAATREGNEHGSDWGEGGHWWLNFPVAEPVVAYAWCDQREPAPPQGRKRNLVANSLLWELTGPVPQEELRALRQDPDEEVPRPNFEHRWGDKLRGTVVFHPSDGKRLSGRQKQAIQDAYDTATEKLKAKGWL